MVEFLEVSSRLSSVFGALLCLHLPYVLEHGNTNCFLFNMPAILCIFVHDFVLSFQRPLARGSPTIFEVVKFYQKAILKAESSNSGSGMLFGNLLKFILLVLSAVVYTKQLKVLTVLLILHSLHNTVYSVLA